LMQASLGAQRPSLWAIRSELPKEVDAWVQKALAISPDERFAKVSELWSMLSKTLGF